MEAGLQPLGLDARVGSEAPIRLVPPAQPIRLVVFRAFIIVLCSSLGIYLLALAPSARTAFSAGAVWFSGCFVLGMLGLSVWLMLAQRRTPGEVTDDSVRLYVGLSRRERVIPLESIAAVGMVFIRQSRSPSGWSSFLWLEDGESVPLGLDVCLCKSSDDWETIAATPQGRLCLQILDRARSRQNASGPIARDRTTDRGIGWRSAYWPANRSVAAAA